MKLFERKPADEVGTLRRSLEETRQKLTGAQGKVDADRTALRRALAAGEDPSSAEAALEAARADADRLTARESELSAALEDAEARSAAAAKEADLDGLRAKAEAAKKDGEKAATEAVKALRSFVLAWGRVEAARETIDHCGRFAERHFAANLGVNPTLPNKYQFVDLAAGDLTGGRFVREDLDGLGYFLAEQP